MRYQNSVFGKLIKPISRRQFAAIVQRHSGDAYDKCFKSWDHLLSLIFAQLTAAADHPPTAGATRIPGLDKNADLPHSCPRCKTFGHSTTRRQWR